MREIADQCENRLVVMSDSADGGVDWAGLRHNHGLAVDTPGHLRGLLDPDPRARMAAVDHLNEAYLEQFVIRPAAAAAVAGVCPVLERILELDALAGSGSSLALPGAEDSAPVRAELLLFLRGVADLAVPGETSERLAAISHPAGLDDLIGRLTAGRWDKKDNHSSETYKLAEAAVSARAVLACRAQAPVVVETVRSWIGAPGRQVWQAAAAALSLWASLLDDPVESATLTRKFAQEASLARDPEDRAVWVLALRDLGADTSAFLTDDSPMVRTCAALSATVAADPRSLAEILAALEALPYSDRWFPLEYPFLEVELRFILVGAAIKRVATFDQLLPAALQVAALANPFWVHSDCEPLLHFAFPVPHVRGAPLPDAQRRFLIALADRQSLWTGNNACLRQLHLPDSREGLMKLASTP